jgi:glucose/mannose transport system substrate-binding protein
VLWADGPADQPKEVEDMRLVRLFRSGAITLLTLVLALGALFASPAAAAPSGVGTRGQTVALPAPSIRLAAASQLEIFSWWTTGGEAAGLTKLFEMYGRQYPGVEIINATVAGGAGSNAKAVLKTRMLGGDPPDSFQVHMGHELIDTWVVSEKMEPLDDIYAQMGFTTAFPKGVLDIVSYQGHPYSVPVNIHRANVLWYNTQVFANAGLQPPNTFDEFFQVADALQARGITPLALGDVGAWADANLFETVLIGTLGPEAYKGLWTGQTSWNDPLVTQALETAKRMLAYTNADHSALSWDQANDMVITGTAGMTIMGDWVDADNLAKKFPNSGWVMAPGNQGVFDALSDTFGLPKGARHPEEARNWLRLIGTAEAQDAFNPLKGSIPANVSAGKATYTPYLQQSMQAWTTDAIVPSLAHGAAASEGWLTSIQDVLTIFVTRQDVVATQQALVLAATDAGVGR